MKKIILFFTLISALTSCHMASYYGNMRIKHNYKETLPARQADTAVLQKNHSYNAVKASQIDSLAPKSPTAGNAHINRTAYEINPGKQVKVKKPIKNKHKRQTFFPVFRKNKLQQVFKPSTSSTILVSGVNGVGGFFEALLWIAILGGIVLLVIFTWEFLAAFWIALGIVSLIILGVCIGMWLIIEAIFGIIFEALL